MVHNGFSLTKTTQIHFLNPMSYKYVYIIGLHRDNGKENGDHYNGRC